MCGEQKMGILIELARTGSSPRVRGAAVGRSWCLSVAGIIPACAGSRVICPLPADLLQDHPRVCGEQLRLPTSACSAVGSSPHVRGAGPVFFRLLWM